MKKCMEIFKILKLYLNGVNFFKLLGLFLGCYYIYEMPSWYKECYPDWSLIIEGELVCLLFVVFCIISLSTSLTDKFSKLLKITGILGLTWYIFKGIPADLSYYLHNHTLQGLFWLLIDICSVYYVIITMYIDHLLNRLDTKVKQLNKLQQIISVIGLVLLYLLGIKLWIK